MANVLANKTNDDRLLLMTYRLMYQVGILKRGDAYTEMAQIALDQGNPGEAQTILEQAFAKNLYHPRSARQGTQRAASPLTRSSATRQPDPRQLAEGRTRCGRGMRP